MTTFKSKKKRQSKSSQDPSEITPYQQSSAQNPIFRMQSILGNKATIRYLAGAPSLQRWWPFPILAPANELSGADWVDRFPTSRDVSDLVAPFQTNVQNFLNALTAAGATCHISATLRPPQRAYLMHYAWKIAKNGLNPASVPAYSGPGDPVNIDWVHRNAKGRVNRAASKAAARAMVAGYGLKHIAALDGRHLYGRAIDITISWEGNLTIKNASGEDVVIRSTPRTGADNHDLHKVGATYNVIKLVSPKHPDPPHWSDDGH